MKEFQIPDNNDLIQRAETVIDFDRVDNHHEKMERYKLLSDILKEIFEYRDKTFNEAKTI